MFKYIRKKKAAFTKLQNQLWVTSLFFRCSQNIFFISARAEPIGQSWETNWESQKQKDLFQFSGLPI